MDNFPSNKYQSNVITLTTKSLIPAMLVNANNNLMIGQSLGSTNALNLVRKNNIDLEKLVDMKVVQAGVRKIADEYLSEDYSAIIMSLATTEITSFANRFTIYNRDIASNFNKFFEPDEDEDKDVLLADTAARIQRIITEAKKRKKKCNECLENVQDMNEKNAVLNKKFNRIQEQVEQLYRPDKAEVKALQTRLKQLQAEIDKSNHEIANGALDENILKIAIRIITEFPSKDSEVEVGDLEPLVINTLQLFNKDDEPIPSVGAENLDSALQEYRECIVELKKISSEVAIFSNLMEQWGAFLNNMLTIEKYIKYIALGWQELEQNLSTLQQKIASKDRIVSDIVYAQNQCAVAGREIKKLHQAAINAQKFNRLEFVNYTTTYIFREKLGIPYTNDPELTYDLLLEKYRKQSDEDDAPPSQDKY